ncbi:hypothetical protein pXoo2106_06 [Xanthomonas phage pXoo2106]|uniref:Uncharacterized protein n=1 Tax=Xanthomonas phage pXoo2106 TaxID=2970483 RepID=A0AAX3C0Y2_9CAUD|nr:hypothetical protein pXoo2106_06 [Xanthomonas phage pXoo2106]
MREVSLRYRVHMTSLKTGAQWYIGQNHLAPDGWTFEHHPDALARAQQAETADRIADVEEYEIPPVNKENHHA